MPAGRPPKGTEPWYKDAAARMVREGVSLREAASLDGLALTVEEAARLMKLQSFQKILWQARSEYYTEIGGDPARTKQTVIGQMVLAAQKLMEAAEWEKAAAVNDKIAKIMGWAGPESEVNVFGGLSQKDLDEIKKTLRD